ncbi:leader peptidase (prepilin peptidase) / N-methyltransferase [Fictibacillus solisalsi]|uniref:Leader peptidase (Prepilin peptidase) / N-methyltransferase n=1 Tax=Fictibacillus solisalsi TaxID=459525 RepID=A0A1G9WS46_9BACL|nr:A24 family peptidase [Fictibacillus solisalsi]SDM87424.1 leader peptidase (prepilin peptidase) / N-methyltransferase [Fictibacillus solisalsi]
MENAFILFIGLVIGSFCNVAGLRIPQKKSIVYPGSSCPACDRKLGWYEMIPVVSWVIQRGSCRGCKEKILILYPVTELLTGLLFMFSLLLLDWSFELLLIWSLISMLAIITVSDLVYMVIPDCILLFFGGLFILLRSWVQIGSAWDPLFGFLLGFGLLYTIAATSGGGMGGGDIKLMGVAGIVLGWKAVLLAFMLALFLGAVFGTAGLALKRLNRKQRIPFGPFLAAGILLSYFFYEEIAGFYFSRIH